MKNLLDVIHVTTAHDINDVRINKRFAQSGVQAGLVVGIVALSSETKNEIVNNIHHFEIGSSTKKNRFLRSIIGSLRVVIFSLSLKPKVVQLHDPEIILWIILFRVFGIKVIFDAHEDFASMVNYKTWVRGYKKTIFRLYSSFLIYLAEKFTTKIIVATDGVSKGYKKSNPLTIRNFPLTNEKNLIDLNDLVRSQDIGYIGGISIHRGILTILEALEMNENVRYLQLAGKFEDENIRRECFNHRGWKKVKYWGYVDHNTAQEIMKKCRIGLSTLHDTPNHRLSIPVKLLEYYSLGLPVIASNFQEWRDFCWHSKTAITIEPSNPEALSKAIDLLFDDHVLCKIYENILKGPRKDFTWEEEAKKVIKLYNEII